jgi:hypothetical protein
LSSDSWNRSDLHTWISGNNMNSSVNFLFEVRVIHRGHALMLLAIFRPKGRGVCYNRAQDRL